MPATSDAILAQLNAPARVVPEVLSTDILPGHKIGTPEHLFKKIDEKMAETWRAQFGGEEAKPDGVAAAAKPNASKRKAAAAAKKVDGIIGNGADVPKTPEILALEAKVTEQGQVVRALKAQTPKTPEVETQIKAAVEVLKALKGEVAVLSAASK